MRYHNNDPSMCYHNSYAHLRSYMPPPPGTHLDAVSPGQSGFYSIESVPAMAYVHALHCPKHNPEVVTTSLTLLGPVLVWSQELYEIAENREVFGPS